MMLLPVAISIGALSVGVCQLVLRFARRLNLLDVPVKRSLHRSPIPRAGGLALLVGVFISGFTTLLSEVPLPVLLNFNSLSSLGLIDAGFILTSKSTLALIFGFLLVYAGGYLDDLKLLRSARAKFGFQVVGSLLVGFSFWLNTGKIEISVLSFCFVLLMTNSFNLMDNMNGLTGGLSVLIFSTVGYLALSGGPNNIIMSICLGVVPALVVFLFYNFPKAKLFLGDQGSQSLGFLAAIAALSIATNRINEGEWSVLVAMLWVLLLFGLFFVDTLLVIVIRLREGRPIYVGDKSHLSHQLVSRGLSQTRAVMALWLIQVVLSVVFYLGASTTKPSLIEASLNARAIQLASEVGR